MSGSVKELIEQLYDRRVNLVQQQKELHAQLNVMPDGPRYEAVNQEFDARHEEIRLIGERIDELLDRAERANDADAQRNRFEFIRNGGKMETQTDNGLASWLRHGGQPYFDVTLPNTMTTPLGTERHDLTKGGSPGSELLPTTFGAFIQAFVAQSGVLQTNARVLNTTSGENVIVPKQTGFGTANLITEGASITEVDPALAQVTLSAYKYASLMQASREVIEDSAVDVEQMVGSSLGKSIGVAVATAYISGTGSSQPQGVNNAPTAGVTLSSGQTTTITSADSLIDLFFSVSPPYRKNAFWLTSDTTLAILRKIKASTAGTYILEFNSGDPIPRIMGAPVVIDNNMPVPAANAFTVLFGDFSEYFLIRNANQVRIERSDDFAFQNDLVTFRGILRTDSKQTINGASGAVKALKQSAT
jgi:HK97 family phage major capsid protein